MKKKYLLLLILLILISLLYACQPEIVEAEPQVESIFVDGMIQYYYFVGDTLNLSEAKLYLTYDDGNIEIIPLQEEHIVSGLKMDFPGVKEVAVNYGKAQTTLNVEVLDLVINKVEIKDPPNKTTYVEGTDFDVTGATMDVHFEGGRIINVRVLRNNVTQYDPYDVGENKQVKISYRSYTLSIPITITPKALDSISVKTLPTNKSVFVGHDINPAGMVLNFKYNNGKIEEKNAKDLTNLEFIFTNTAETPSTEVSVKYTLYTAVDVFKEFFTTFKIQVLNRVWKSMKILEYPITNGILIEPAQYDENGKIVRDETRTAKTNLQNIIQGDTIDFSTGSVEVTFDDNTKETYPMSSNLLKIYNEQKTERAEIQGLTINTIEKKNVPSGDCNLDFSVIISESQYIYDSEPEIKVTAKNRNEQAVRVIKSGENYSIEVEKEQIYTIIVTATVITTQVIDGISQDVMLITSKSFKITGEGAIEPRRALDISTSGSYKLSIIYMENANWNTSMNVNVVNRKPVTLELQNTSDVTEPAKPYILGDKVNISFVKYRLIYDNGDVEPWQPVTPRMLSADVNLNCDYATTVDNPKKISFTLYGVTSRYLEVKVVPLSVDHLELDPPINTYVAQGAAIDPKGGTLTAYMNNNTKHVYDLLTIIGMGEDYAQIINDADSNNNNTVSETVPYTATIYFRHKAVTFEYYVVEKTVESLQLIRDENVKSTYYENESLDLSGLTLRVRYRDNSTETVPVTIDMLYKYDQYKVGPQTLRIRYKGVLYEQFSIVVLPKQIVEITILQKPRILYVYGIDNSLDLSAIRINKKYNDGSEQEQIGIQLGLDGSGYGWTANTQDIQFRLLDVIQSVVLTYRDYYHDVNPLTISYEIQIKEDIVEAIYLSRPDDQNPNDIIGTVAKGMDLNLFEISTEGGEFLLNHKLIYVKFMSSDELKEVPLTPSMVKYEKADVTVGDRRAKIEYSYASCYGYVRVLNSVMTEVSIEKMPKTDYILGEELDLSKGIIKRTFRNENSGQLSYDYLPMQNDASSITGFDTTLKESDYESQEKFKQRLITVYYLDFSYSFHVKIYKKFNATLRYFSTISFYGDVSLPYIMVEEDIVGFALPHTATYFINLSDIIPTLPDGYSEEITFDENGNVLSIRYFADTKYYIKVVLQNSIVGYIDEEKRMTASNYPNSPAQGVNKYLILVQVQGNRYYNTINYAEREFRIINKYINVNAVVPNKDAIVWRYNTSDNARAVYLVSNYIEYLLLEKVGLNIILASPTYDGFEVIITSSGNHDLTQIKGEIERTITEAYWTYTEILTDGNGQPLLDIYGNYRIKIHELKQENMPDVSNPIKKKVQILDFEKVIGVNYRIFDEGNDVISYYVPSGGLIAIRDIDNFFVTELFSGQLYRSDFDRFDVIYEVSEGVYVNGFDIEDEQLNGATTVLSGYEIRMQQGVGSSLVNPNYFITFQSQRYIIAPRTIVETEIVGKDSEKYEYDGKMYDIVRTGYDGLQKHVSIRYKTEINGAWKNLEATQIRYYRILDEENGDEVVYEEGSYPVGSGLYRARITHNYIAEEGYEGTVVWECLFRIT